MSITYQIRWVIKYGYIYNLLERIKPTKKEAWKNNHNFLSNREKQPQALCMRPWGLIPGCSLDIKIQGCPSPFYRTP